MADHHVDSLKNFDYSAEAEKILKKRGMFIVDAPPINHKPGNDLWSDVYYPLPNRDDRWANPVNDNNQIKNPNIGCCDCCDYIDEPEPLRDFYEMDDEILHDVQSIKNPVITYINDIGKTLFDDVVYKYTGLTLQAIEKKAFTVSFLKPKYRNLGKDRTVELVSKEVITGHTISIATFDGWKYHIFRGLVRDIIKVNESDTKIRSDQITSGPHGTFITTENKELQRGISESRGFYNHHLDNTVLKLMKRNVRIVLDVSEPFNSKVECIPVNQIIDIQDYNFVYNFTIYEGKLNLLWKDWYQTIDKEDNKWTTYVPFGWKYPQNLLHPVIEHQKPDPNNIIVPENPEREEPSTDEIDDDFIIEMESSITRLGKVNEEFIESLIANGDDSLSEEELSQKYVEYSARNIIENLNRYKNTGYNFVDVSIGEIFSVIERCQSTKARPITNVVVIGNYDRIYEILDSSGYKFNRDPIRILHGPDGIMYTFVGGNYDDDYLRISYY